MAQYTDQLFLAPHAAAAAAAAAPYNNALVRSRQQLHSLGAYTSSNGASNMSQSSSNSYQNLIHYQQNASTASHFPSNGSAVLPFPGGQQMGASQQMFSDLHNSEEYDRRSRKVLTAVPHLSLLPYATVREDRKYAYKFAEMKEIFKWYMSRQQAPSKNVGHRAIVENLIIYLEGLRVTYRDKDISVKETVNWTGNVDMDGGPRPDESFRDSLTTKSDSSAKKTCTFITDTVTNFLHTGTLGSLCMMETISSYFIPVRNGAGLSKSEIYEDPNNICENGVGFKKLVGGYSPGECGSLFIHHDGTYTLKAYGIIVVVGIDFVAMTCKPVTIERLTTSSIRLLHPRGQYNLPKHVLRYQNRPISSDLILPNTAVKQTETAIGTMVYMYRTPMSS